MAVPARKACQVCGALALRQANVRLDTQILHPPAHSAYNKTVRCSSGRASKMAAWQVHQYGGVDELTFSDFAKVASIKGPNEMIVQVNASSVNPIDVRMLAGYGHNAINILRNLNGVTTPDSKLRLPSPGTEFPLVLGRDFSGTVVETGRGVKKFRVGDEIWGALNAWRPGTHAEFTVVSQDEISKKPSTLTHTQAASIPYVAATTWAALCTVGQLTESQAMGKRILILGGSGGIGSFAIQMCRAWGMDVTVTCKQDAHQKAMELGATYAVDYSIDGGWGELGCLPGFDYILDTVGNDATDKAASLMEPYKNAKLITLNFPLLRNTDSVGVLPGLVKSAACAAVDTVKGIKAGGNIRWAAFNPSAKAMDKVRRMVEANQIQPVVQKVFPFSETPEAYRMVEGGGLRGKIVINTDSSQAPSSQEESKTGN